ncbi:MAG: hypothetical protein FJZ64_02235 [Chlamydiae bacterium]|nr:hypothetical protein [Chlamydiota bacterium]
MIGPFQEIIFELGKLFRLKLHPDAVGACSILIPPELIVQLQLDSAQEKLFLFAKIAELPPGKFRENVLLESLKANSRPDPLLGILGYIHPINHLALFQSYPLSILNGERLANLFGGFVETAESWRKAIQSGQNTPIPKSQSPFFERRP